MWRSSRGSNGAPDDSRQGGGTFPLVLDKDPNRRKSRTGSRVRPRDSAPPNGSSKSPRANPRRGTGRQDAGSNRFVLYVEGARDREILGCWARRVDPGLARCIESSTIILGGRQPARALSDFEKRGGTSAGYSGIVLLDRDHHDQLEAASADEPGFAAVGLEVFVWSLRHIESYLLVPAAIRRMLGLEIDDRTVERFLAELPAEALGAESLHAKRVLGAGGLLSEALGAELRAGDIARAMRLDDLHADVRLLLDRIGSLSGQSPKGPEVVIRAGVPVRGPTDS